ncbi:MAG: ATP-binding cassette domain-containing protein [Candidatus Korarchaeota archaeon]|nr:ATP-binding cassette domain-containing protein [Candidatus Korarchaeota archaeon]
MPREIYALLGGNGAGKTTLMNILYGIYKPDEGEIYVRGRKVKIRSPKDVMRLGIGMVHQYFLLVDRHVSRELSTGSS